MSGAVLGFRPGDLETAEWMSKRTGQELRSKPSYADPSTPRDLGVRPTWSPKGKRIPVANLFGMPQGRALVWLPRVEAPVHARIKGYFDIPELAGGLIRSVLQAAGGAAFCRTGTVGVAQRGCCGDLVGALAAGVALGPTFEEYWAAARDGFRDGSQRPEHEIHKRSEEGLHPATPRKMRSAAPRAATRETEGFP